MISFSNPANLFTIIQLGTSSSIWTFDNVGFLPTFLYLPLLLAMATPSLWRFRISTHSNWAPAAIMCSWTSWKTTLFPLCRANIFRWMRRSKGTSLQSRPVSREYRRTSNFWALCRSVIWLISFAGNGLQGMVSFGPRFLHVGSYLCKYRHCCWFSPFFMAPCWTYHCPKSQVSQGFSDLAGFGWILTLC